jgi:hypothetical protein
MGGEVIVPLVAHGEQSTSVDRHIKHAVHPGQGETEFGVIEDANLYFRKGLTFRDQDLTPQRRNASGINRAISDADLDGIGSGV